MRSLPVLFAVFGLLTFAGLGCEPSEVQSEIEVSLRDVIPRAISPVSAPVSQIKDGLKMSLTKVAWVERETTIPLPQNGSSMTLKGGHGEKLPLLILYELESLTTKDQRWEVDEVTIRQPDGRKPPSFGVGYALYKRENSETVSSYFGYVKVEGLLPTLPWMTLEITLVNSDAPPEETGRFSSELIFENIPMPAEGERLDVEKTLISKLGTKVSLMSVERRVAEIKCVFGIEIPDELPGGELQANLNPSHPWWEVDRQGKRHILHPEGLSWGHQEGRYVIEFDYKPPPTAIAFVLPFEFSEHAPALRQEKHARRFIFHLATPQLPALPVPERPPVFASQKAGDVTVTLEGFNGNKLWFTTKTEPETVTKGRWFIKEIKAETDEGRQHGGGLTRHNWYPNGELPGTDERIQTWGIPVQDSRETRVDFQFTLGREKSKILKLSGLPVPPRGEGIALNKKIRIERRMNLVLESVRFFASGDEVARGLEEQSHGLALVFHSSRWTNLDILSAHDGVGKDLVKRTGTSASRGGDNQVTVFLRAPFPDAKTFNLELWVDYDTDQKTITFEDLENVFFITAIDNFEVSPQAAEVFHITKEEREVLNKAIDKSRSNFSQTVASYTTVEYPPDGGVLLHISSFPEKGESIQQSLDSTIKAVLGESRFERFHKLAQGDFEPLFYHFGKADYTVKISKPSERSSTVQIESRYRSGLSSGSSSSTQQHIPEKYRYFIDLMPPELLPYYSGTSR